MRETSGITRLASAAWLAAAAVACSNPKVVDSPIPEDSVPTLVLTAEMDGEVPRLALVEELRISGTSDSLSWAYIGTIAVSDRGDTYVVDGLSNEIQAFDRSGELTRRFGGPGGGPGELNRPTSISFASDTLSIIDSRGLNQFEASGTFIRRVPIRGGVYGTRTGVTFYPRTLAHTAIGLVTSYNPWQSSNPSDTTFLHIVDAKTGQISPPVVHVIGAPLYRVTESSYRYAWGTEYYTFTVSEDGRLFVPNTGGIDVDIISLTSGERSRIRWDVPRQRVREKAVAAAVREIEESLAEWPSYIPGPRDPKEYLNAVLQVPRSKYRQVVGRLVAAATGELLVERRDLRPRLLLQREPSVWDVVTEKGTVMGRVEFPAGYTPLAMVGRAVTGVATDSLDVPSVVRYRLQLE